MTNSKILGEIVKMRHIIYCLILLAANLLCFDAMAKDISSLTTEIKSRIQRDNPDWKASEESFFLSENQNGLHIMIAGANIKNLSSLKKYNFDSVWLLDTGITDLDFLIPSQTRILALRKTKTQPESIDISAMKGKNIERLALINVKVKDFSPLYHSPFRYLTFCDISNVNFEKFTNLRQLEALYLLETPITDLSFLKKCPKLRQVILGDIELPVELFQEKNKLPRSTARARIGDFASGDRLVQLECGGKHF